MSTCIYIKQIQCFLGTTLLDMVIEVKNNYYIET